MIGRLNGILIEKQVPVLLIDVQGVGYEVEASMNTFSKLPELGQQVTLHTHFVVREDAQLLYAFADKEERSLFRTLIKVNGVGPKLAITILSSIEPNEFVVCVNNQDTARLVKLPGVGKKTAERLIIEMRDRLADWQGDLSFADHVSGQLSLPQSQKQIQQEAISALVALGYKPQDASRMIAKVNQEDISCENLIRLALKGMTA